MLFDLSLQSPLAFVLLHLGVDLNYRFSVPFLCVFTLETRRALWTLGAPVPRFSFVFTRSL